LKKVESKSFNNEVKAYEENLKKNAFF